MLSIDYRDYEFSQLCQFIEERIQTTLVQLGNILIKGESAEQLALAKNQLVDAYKLLSALKTKQDSRELPAEKEEFHGDNTSHLSAGSERASST